MNKIHRGKFNNWQVHTLSVDELRDQLNEIYPELVDVKVLQVITGTITDDTSGKLNDYDHCRSSFVINIDRENGKLETLNSVYDLGLEGNDVIPDLGNGVLSVFY